MSSSLQSLSIPYAVFFPTGKKQPLYDYTDKTAVCGANNFIIIIIIISGVCADMT